MKIFWSDKYQDYFFRTKNVSVFYGIRSKYLATAYTIKDLELICEVED